MTGFVGTAVFPLANSIFTTAVHLAGMMYIWDIDWDDVSLGVTANLIARRNVKDDVKFVLTYPKTGRGENLHFCIEKRNSSIQNHGKGFGPAVLVTCHWWNSGSRGYWRFYNWSFGDGAIVKHFPEHTYMDFGLD